MTKTVRPRQCYTNSFKHHASTPRSVNSLFGELFKDLLGDVLGMAENNCVCSGDFREDSERNEIEKRWKMLRDKSKTRYANPFKSY